MGLRAWIKERTNDSRMKEKVDPVPTEAPFDVEAPQSIEQLIAAQIKLAVSPTVKAAGGLSLEEFDAALDLEQEDDHMPHTSYEAVDMAGQLSDEEVFPEEELPDVSDPKVRAKLLRKMLQNQSNLDGPESAEARALLGHYEGHPDSSLQNQAASDDGTGGKPAAAEGDVSTT